MQKGDNVLIDYNSKHDIKKVATFKESFDGKNLFADIHGDFYINR